MKFLIVKLQNYPIVFLVQIIKEFYIIVQQKAVTLSKVLHQSESGINENTKTCLKFLVHDQDRSKLQSICNLTKIKCEVTSISSSTILVTGRLCFLTTKFLTPSITNDDDCCMSLLKRNRTNLAPIGCLFESKNVLFYRSKNFF